LDRCHRETEALSKILDFGRNRFICYVLNFQAKAGVFAEQAAKTADIAAGRGSVATLEEPVKPTLSSTAEAKETVGMLFDDVPGQATLGNFKTIRLALDVGGEMAEGAITGRVQS
jgi:hypothetical protein